MILSGTVTGDELPDRFAEKSLAVEVRATEMVIEYRVGLSTNEMKRYCETWGGAPAQEGASQLMQDFAEQLSQHLAEQLEVRLNGQAAPLQLTQVRPGGQHHVSAVLEFKLEWQGSPTGTSLQIVDRSFPELGGAIRLACKGRGEVMLRKSNAAVLVVRATRHEFKDLTPEAREKVSTLEALILISDPSKSK